MEDYYIVSPHGRVTAVDSEEMRDRWLAEGFRMATEDEIAASKQEWEAVIAEQQRSAELERGPSDVYFHSVRGDTNDGYGTSSQALMTHLRDAGVRVTRTYKNQPIGLLYHPPHMNMWLENSVKIIYTMFESTKIPESWVGYLRQVDRVLVPSHFCMEVFARDGIAAEVVPLGINEKVFTPLDRSARLSSGRDEFTFLHYNAFNARKGFLELMAAWQQAFTPEEPVRLILKTNTENWRNLFPFITEGRNPNIQVIDDSLEPAGMLQLLGSVDAFVFPARGEGFGLPPLEAMATGLPVIAPNAHGISEYFNPDCMYDVKIAEMAPAIHNEYKGMDIGQMPIIDVDDLAAKLRYVYEHQEEAAEKGRRAAEHAKQFTYTKTALLLNAIFQEYLK